MRSVKHLDAVISENTREVVELDRQDIAIESERDTPETREIARERGVAIRNIHGALAELEAINSYPENSKED